jgi:hypothetical protein
MSTLVMVKPFSTGAKRNRGGCGRAGTVAAIASLLATGAAAMGAAEPSSAGREAAAHAARSLNGTAEARLHLVRAEGSRLVEEGPVSGAITGSARGDLVTGAAFKADFTIHTRAGSIDGEGRAAPHGAGRYQSFAGSFTVTGGSGRYAHIGGRAGLYGVFDRRADSVVIQTTGKLSY